MKRSDFTGCAMCKRPVPSGRPQSFYRFRLEYMALDMAAVMRAAVAETSKPRQPDPGEDLAKQIVSMDGLLCFSCALEHPVVSIHESQVDALLRAPAPTPQGVL